MRTVVVFGLVSTFLPGISIAQQGLKDYFEGRRVTIKIDMPDATKGVNLHLKPGSGTFDDREYQESLEKYGVSIFKGESAKITLIKVKGKLIEFHLGNGGKGKPRFPQPAAGGRQKSLEQALESGHAGYYWIKARGRGIPVEAIQGGEEQGGRLYICRATHKGSIYPGKIREEFGGCNIAYDDEELTIADYEVLAFQGARPAPEWTPTTWSQNLPADAVRGGKAGGYSPSYLCRARYKRGRHPGSLKSGLHSKCLITYEGETFEVGSYDVLTNQIQNDQIREEVAQLQSVLDVQYRQLVSEGRRLAKGLSPDFPGSRFNLRYGDKKIARSRTIEQVLADLSQWVEFP